MFEIIKDVLGFNVDFCSVLMISRVAVVSITFFIATLPAPTAFPGTAVRTVTKSASSSSLKSNFAVTHSVVEWDAVRFESSSSVVTNTGVDVLVVVRVPFDARVLGAEMNSMSSSKRSVWRLSKEISSEAIGGGFCVGIVKGVGWFDCMYDEGGGGGGGGLGALAPAVAADVELLAIFKIPFFSVPPDPLSSSFRTFTSIVPSDFTPLNSLPLFSPRPTEDSRRDSRLTTDFLLVPEDLVGRGEDGGDMASALASPPPLLLLPLGLLSGS
jgi:hypothetical protein